MQRFISLVALLSYSAYTLAASCGPVDSDYGIYSTEEIKIESGVSINGNSIDKDDYSGNTGIETDGNSTSDTVTIPGFSPSNFPGNGSSKKVDEKDSPIDGSSEVFFEEVKIKKNKSLTFTGSGPFHIEELKIEENATLNLSSGTYYIEELEAKKNGRINITGVVRIHIGDEMKIEQGFKVNQGGDPENFQVLLHEDAKFELKENLQFVGIVIGQEDTEIKIESGVQFTGSILTDGSVEIKKNSQILLSAGQQAAISNISTCDAVGGGGGGGGGEASSCGAIDSTYGIHTGTKLKIDSGVTINGNSVTKKDHNGDTALEVDGEVSSPTPTVPELDPVSFPNNNASADLDEDDSPLDGSSPVFVDKIEVGKGDTFTFTGAGPFYIDELKVDDNATVNFSAGIYFIRKGDIEKRVTLNVGATVRLHIDEELKLDKDTELNASGNPEDLLIFLHSSAKYEAKERTTTVGVIVGVDNEEVKFKNDANFTGAILSEGEVELDKRVTLTLTPTQQTNIGKLSTCANSDASAVDHFVLVHDNNGVNCLDEVITVTAMDSNGDPILDYEGLVVLTTQSGFGGFALASGNGALTDPFSDDGLAVYEFVEADDGQISVLLSYQQGPSTLDIDVYENDDTAIRDDDTEAALVFSPSGFTVTASALSNPPPASINDPIQNQIAGSNFSLHIAAYGVSPADGTCGIIESYDGDQSLSFWMDYANPATGTLVATVNGVGIATNEAGSSIQTITFTNGQASVIAKYKDVGQVQIEMKDTSIRGATSPFIVSPANFVVTSVVDGASIANPAAANMSGASFVAAGENFVVLVEVRDAEGSLTPNFGNENVPEGLLMDLSLVEPVSGGSGALANASSFVASGTAGTFRNATLSWNQVGIIRLRANVGDGNYLGAGNVSGSFSGNVGRFRPASFVLATAGVVGACANTTYMDQPALGVSVEVQAQDTAGNVLTNYDGSLLSVVASLNLVAEDNNSGANLSSRLSVPTSSWINGVRSMSSSTEQFSRGVSADGPYENLQLGVQLLDSLDGVGLSGLDMNASTAGDCIAATNCNAKAVGVATQIYYGQLEVLNTFGSETEPLEVGLRTTIFGSGGSFVTNTSDSCTSYIDSGASLSNYQDGLPTVSIIRPSSSTQIVNGLSVPGLGLLLSSPGATNTGSVDVTYDAPTWLEGIGNDDPTGTATFGQFRGHDKVIYWREVY